MGLVIIIATSRPPTINTNWSLLKFSFNTSNVFDGATRVKNRSRPNAKTRDVDSSSAGDVTIFLVFATCTIQSDLDIE